MKKYKFTILLLLTFVIAFPVITVKLVTAEQEKKARQEELAQVTDTEKEPAEAVAGTEENSTDKAGTGQADIDSTENTEDKTGIKDNETVADTEQEGTFTTEDISYFFRCLIYWRFQNSRIIGVCRPWGCGCICNDWLKFL